MQNNLLDAFSNFCHLCSTAEDRYGRSRKDFDSSNDSLVSRPDRRSQKTGLACSKEGKPQKSIDDQATKSRRRHASLIDDKGIVICAPMPGWSSEQFAALILALREIPTVPVPPLSWAVASDGYEVEGRERMRLVAARVPGKSVEECFECARYVANEGIGVFANIQKKTTMIP
jgi:hypothetical protein